MNCKICEEQICKYDRDVLACGGIETKKGYVCETCAKGIAFSLIENV